MLRFSVLSVLLSAFGSSATAAEHSTFTYKTIGDRELHAFVISPDGDSASAGLPALLFYHGGGFTVGSPQAGFDIGEALAEHGIVTIAFEYRFTSDPATMDQIIADAKSSVRWTREHAAELGVDRNNVIASGHSAGGYLAAAVDFQPDRYVTSDLPPTIFIHGTADDVVPKERSIQLNERFLGTTSELFLIEGADHFFRAPRFRTQVADLIHEFIEGLGYLN